MDMISKLPPTIIENILCLLPIQETGRTSILSKEWRYHWTKIPKLEFEEDTFHVSGYGDELSALEETFNDVQSERKGMTKRCKLFYAIYQVLLKHEGPIHEFALSMRTDETCVEVDHIISYLLRSNTIKKLKLHMVGGYKLPSSFFLFEHLTDLYLYWCDFDHQPTFRGFDSLTTLFIEFATTTKTALLHLLSSCPLLKRLTLYTDDIDGIGDSNVTNLCECFPMVENLCIWLWTLKCFVQDGVPPVLPTALVHLKCLYIDYMNFVYKHGLSLVLLLIRSSPNLEKLKLQIYDDPRFVESEERSSTLKDCSSIWLGRLNVLEIFNLSNEKPELDFVKLILATSPMLQKVRIFLWKDIDEDDELLVSRILLLSRRVSPVVEIIIKRNNLVYE